MKWYVLQLCVNLLKCSEDPRGGRTCFFLQIFLPYSFRLIGPQTKQGYIHPLSVKVGLSYCRLCTIEYILGNA
jgi:hypothetical protein